MAKANKTLCLRRRKKKCKFKDRASQNEDEAKTRPSKDMTRK
jgi:hypothetical protein